ncbi:hypothetical protein IX38_12915 [Chryseobacterium luteum]|uniref:DUF4595 domain-containing protein n=2 Tax=Chryseobacterium luteum TaxID=421531 RepID=A0A085ZEJ0_9FLAO|nr:hypothetical protein IX38_12915 [Chryseobacterium luteum]
MKITLKNIASNSSNQMKNNDQLHFKIFFSIGLIILLFSSCSDDKSDEIPADINTLACKNRPNKISFGDDTSTIIYNMQDKPIEITTKEYNQAAPTEQPVTTVFKIDYNAQGNVNKVSKFVANHLESSYGLEYNSGGKLIKQSEFNGQGALVASTTSQYDGNVLMSIATHKEGNSVDVTTIYQYADGNLIKKSIQNLYDLDSQEYYNADYTYTYFLDRESKIKTYFEGPLGLLFISKLSNQQSLQYLPNRADYQLYFAKETPSEKKMLKNIEIIAHRYTTHDTTNIKYSYEYDSDGFPTVQRGTYKNITRRYVPTPFGGSVFLVTPHNNTYERNTNYYCN